MSASVRGVVPVLMPVTTTASRSAAAEVRCPHELVDGQHPGRSYPVQLSPPPGHRGSTLGISISLNARLVSASHASRCRASVSIARV
jgi:hypothetical protein